MAINDDERNYLLVEFSESFQHLGKLDDRRYEILQFYASFATAIVAAAFALPAISGLSCKAREIGVGSILLAAFIVSWSFGQVLRSERAATERYRNKLNAIRRTLLSDKLSLEIKQFLELGANISIGLETTEHKDLRFWDIFIRRKHCTALFIKVLIDLGMTVSFFAAITLFYLAFAGAK